MRYSPLAVVKSTIAAFVLFPSVTSLALAAAPAIPGVPGNPDPTLVRGGAYKVEPHHTRVEFLVDHMGFSMWNGDFSGVSGSLMLDTTHVDNSHVDVTIPVASVSTTNATLDSELKSDTWFDAARFPTMHFVSTGVTMLPGSAGMASISGNLTLHGVTRPIVLEAHFHGAGVNPLDKAYTVGFDAITRISRRDFGITTYEPMIGDKVTIRISAAFEGQPQ